MILEVERLSTSVKEEDALPASGKRIGDLCLVERMFLATVPEPVWQYELGNYPILRK